MNKLRLAVILLFAVVAAVFLTVRVASLFKKTSTPVITADPELEISVREDMEEQLLRGVTASDKKDGDLSDRVMIADISELIGDQTVKVTYIVFNSDRKMSSLERTVRLTDYTPPRFRLEKPLTFETKSKATLSDRLFAEDVIDGDISSSIRISVGSETNTEIPMTVEVTNSLGDTVSLDLTITILSADSGRPVITLTDYLIYLPAGSDFDAGAYLVSVTASGERNIPLSAVTVQSEPDTAVPGAYTVTYTYTASSGKTGTATLIVVVE